jgi:tRNA threonylcarbamoyladenosine biosynthesis protein TsaB
MRILAFDTAATACSAVIWIDGTIAARRFETMERGQAEALMPMVDAVLAVAATAYVDLNLIAVTIGPGAFTGLRIGLAAARGLALATGVPCLGVTTFDAVAHGTVDEDRSRGILLVALDAKRSDVYAQAFDGANMPLCAPVATLPAGLSDLVPAGPVTVVGDAAAAARDALTSAGRDAVVGVSPGLPDAATVAGLAAARWRPGDAIPPPPSPLYLRPPDAVVPRDGGRRRPSPAL